MSKSNVVGAVAAMGIPEVNRLVNASMGASSPIRRQKKVTFIGSSSIRPGQGRTAIAQIDAGVDVIYASAFGGDRGGRPSKKI